MQNREFCLGDGFVLSENLENSIQLRKAEKMRLVNTIIFVIYCHVCITLQVNPTNITNLTAENAKELVETNQRILLAEFQNSFYFPKVKKINHICARELAMFDGWELALNGLIEMDKDVAKELVKFKGEKLFLYGLVMKEEFADILRSNKAISF